MVGRPERYLLTLTVLSLAAVTANSAPCVACTLTGHFVWPVQNIQLADDALHSDCDQGWAWPGHAGYDLFAADGSPVYAAFAGRVYRYDEPGTSGSWEWYNLGCGLRLVNGTRTVYYGHLLEGGRAKHRATVNAGDIIGRAGGGQEDEYCRGDSPGPRLYFEMQVRGRYVDPFSCLTNTCRYRYADRRGFCFPDLVNSGSCSVVGALKGVNHPMYSCGTAYSQFPRDTRLNLYYAEATVKETGELDLGCYGSFPNHKRCWSEAYTASKSAGIWVMNPRFSSVASDGPLKQNLNCFLRFLRVHGDGRVDCGGVEGDAVAYNKGTFNPKTGARTGACLYVSGLGIADEEKARNQEYLLLQRITATKDFDIHNKFIVLGSEWEILGVDDERYVTVSMDQDPAAASEQAADGSDPRAFNPAYTEYWVDYILARTCDLAGAVESVSECKNTRIPSPEGQGMDYDEWVERGGYRRCEYNFVDAGKVYDQPGLFFTVFSQSRFGANRGELYYN